MSNYSPEVSFVLCIYNGEKYIKQAINSVLAQDFTNFELILVDDGSTDCTLDIIRNYELEDLRCRVFTGPNQGVVPARNLGIAHSKGEFIALMDGDDICMPNRISMQLNYLHAHPKCVAVGSCVMLIDPNGNNIKPLLMAIDHNEIDTANLSRRGCSIVHPTAVIRKSALLKTGLYQEEFNHAEDIDLFLRLAEVGELKNLPETLLHYRQHMSSIGYKHAHSQRNSINNAVTAAYIRRGLQEPQESIEKMIDPVRTSSFDIYNKWAWWALNGGNIGTARHYGLLAIRSSPFRFSNLRLLICLIRGR